jgi:hypothetical protein
MNDPTESASSATPAGRTVGRTRGEHAASHPPSARRERAATQSSEAETPEAEGAPVQLSLFPTVAEPPQLLAPLFHIRCHDCQTANDVPSLPTICYMCRCPLGREHPSF